MYWYTASTYPQLHKKKLNKRRFWVRSTLQDRNVHEADKLLNDLRNNLLKTANLIGDDFV